MVRLALFLALAVQFAVSALGQNQQSSSSATPQPGGSTQSSPVAPNAPEGTPEAVPPPSERNTHRYRTGNVWWCVSTVCEIALPAIVLFTGLSARLRDFARRIGRKWFFALCIYFTLLAAILFAAALPLDYYLGFVRPHAYGLSNQTFAKWFADSLKQFAVGVGIGASLLWVPYLLLKKSPRRWWLYAGLGMVPFYLLSQMAQPVFFDPLFNDFTPLSNQALEARILALADRAGIHGSRVFQVNKSVDTKTVNAYVTGFLGTKRIVLWDTTLSKLTDHEILFVMGHEMGHYVLGHVTKGILCLSALTFVAFYLIHRTAGLVIARTKNRLGFDQLLDVASLPLLMLLTSVFSLVLTPIGFAYSRHLEHEADRFGLEITRFNHSAATGFVRLQEENLGYPRPGRLYTIVRATHPSIGDRIDFFNSYKPWERGEPSKYERYFELEPGATNRVVTQ